MIASDVIAELTAAGHTLATAESITGGQLAAVLTEVPGASQAYVGGVVTYATDLKISLLGVPRELVDTCGVVSAECARAMSEGARRLTGATYALSTTGVAGPERQEDKPVGTAYVGLAGPSGTQTVELHLEGGRGAIQSAVLSEAISLLRDVMQREEQGLR